MDEMKKLDPLQVLLSSDLPDMRENLPHAMVELPRLSELAGAPVLFEVRGLTYKEIREIREIGKDQSLHGVLAGCVSPNFHDPGLLDQERHILSNLDAVRARLLPGEIEDLFIKINHLSGYMRTTIRDVKND